MTKKDFYNGNKLLSLRDINGNKPEVFFIVGNRTAGKTYFFKRWLVRRALKYEEPFTYFVRNIDDVPNAGAGFWEDIGPIDFPDLHMTQKPLLNGKAAALLINDKVVGQVVALNDAERIKRNSALFAISYRGFLDEFASETNKYIPGEIRKFNSIRASISRGGKYGGHNRYFPVYMCSNMVTAYNPYFEYFGVKPNDRANYLRGNGWVYERTYNEAAAESLKQNLRTVRGKEMEYMAGNVALLDNDKFIEKIPGQKYPLFNFIHNGNAYGCWYVYEYDSWYFTHKTADGLPYDFTFNIDDHDRGDILLDKNDVTLKALKIQFRNNRVLFEDGACKNAFMDICNLIDRK